MQKMRITAVGVELIDGQNGDLRWCLDFRDMDSPAIILLSDAYGNKNVEAAGFVLCPLYGRKWKTFTAVSSTTNTAVVSSLVCFNLAHFLPPASAILNLDLFIFVHLLGFGG